MSRKAQKKSRKRIPYPVRINRYLFLQKYCSRRQADRFIQKGLVTINGVTAELGQKVGESDCVEVAQKVSQARQNYRYFACHKPRGMLSDMTGQNTQHKSALELLPIPEKSQQHFAPLGRLDKDSEGLMIFSNDGRIVHALLAPEKSHEKEYLVVLDKTIRQHDLEKMERGVRIEKYTTKPAKAWKVGPRSFRLILTEGKKHQIRRMGAALGYQVQQLKRHRIEDITLDSLRAGECREIIGAEKEQFLEGLL